MIRFVFLAAALMLFIPACESELEKPEDLIKEPVYMDLLTEVFLIRSYAELRDFSEEQEDSLYNVIFEEYEVNLDQFERSHTYYQRQGEVHLARTDSIRNYLRNEREAIMRARQESQED